MKIYPAVIIHGLADAKAALAPGLGVTLLSAPAAAAYAGGLWWAALMRAAGLEGLSLLDCGESPGRAVEAMRLGLPGIVLTCAPAVFAAAGEIAAAQGAVLLPEAPPALDMAERGAPRRLLAWLADDSNCFMG